MKFGTDSHGTQIMNPNDFAQVPTDSFTFVGFSEISQHLLDGLS